MTGQEHGSHGSQPLSFVCVLRLSIGYRFRRCVFVYRAIVNHRYSHGMQIRCQNSEITKMKMDVDQVVHLTPNVENIRSVIHSLQCCA